MTLPVIIDQNTRPINHSSRAKQLERLLPIINFFNIAKNNIAVKFHSDFPCKHKLGSLINFHRTFQSFLLVFIVVWDKAHLGKANDVKVILIRVHFERNQNPFKSGFLVSWDRLDLTQQSFDFSFFFSSYFLHS